MIKYRILLCLSLWLFHLYCCHKNVESFVKFQKAMEIIECQNTRFKYYKLQQKCGLFNCLKTLHCCHIIGSPILQQKPTSNWLHISTVYKQLYLNEMRSFSEILKLIRNKNRKTGNLIEICFKVIKLFRYKNNYAFGEFVK